MVDLFDILETLYKRHDEAKDFRINLENFIKEFFHKTFMSLVEENEQGSISFKDYIKTVSKDIMNIISGLNQDLLKAKAREDLYLIEAAALEKYKSIIVSLKTPNGRSLVIYNQFLQSNLVVNIGEGPIQLIIRSKEGLIYNPILNLLLDEKIMDFIEYYINMRDIFSANNIFDANGNIIDTVGFGIVDAYESYSEEEKKIEGQNNVAR